MEHKTAMEDLICTFFAVSDLHILEKRQARKRAAAWAYLRAGRYDFGLLAGDVTNNGTTEEFETAKRELADLSVPLAYCLGNHDYLGGLSPQPCRVCRMEDIQVICLEFPQERVEAAQIQWLDAALRESDGERLRIVLSHYPLPTWIPGKTGTKQASYLQGSRALQQVLNNHGNILYFAGHTHYTLASAASSVLWDEDRRIGYLNTASVGNTVPDAARLHSLKIQMNQLGADRETVRRQYKALNTSGSQGLHVEVHRDFVQVRGVDYTTGTYIVGCDARLEL